MRTKISGYGAVAILFLSVLMAGSLVVGPAYGVTYNLTAGTVDKTMPDSTVIPMWGFGCTTPQPGCGDGASTAITVPGPQLVVPVGDNTLTINLTNNLTVPVSVVIPGLIPAAADNVSFTDNTGRVRVRSFVHETPASGGPVAYMWNNVHPGTFLYQSGTHPSVQVQMGLYGAVKKDFVAGQAYGPDSAYGSEVILLFSEIDPVLHTAIDNGSYGTPPGPTSTVYYQPQYYLINGEAYSAGDPPIASVTTADNTLLRFLNAGQLTRTPMMLGTYMHPIAEDGYPYGYPKTEYALDLDAGQTRDALVDFCPTGRVVVFDRKGGLTNSTSAPGGMISFLTVASIKNIGVFTNGIWFLDLNGNGSWDGTPTDVAFPSFGGSGVVPVAGDWNGTCKTMIGYFNNGSWYLDLNGNGAWDGTPTDALYPDFGAGLVGAVPVTGDWTGTGTTKVGVFWNGIWYLDLNGNGSWDQTPTDTYYINFGAGLPGAVPVTGDWTGTGTTKVGIFVNGSWYLDLNGNGVWDGTPTDAFYINFGAGLPGAVPVTGDWTGTGTTKIGIFSNGTWFLDLDGDGVYDGTPTDALYINFGAGLPSAVPVIGGW